MGAGLLFIAPLRIPPVERAARVGGRLFTEMLGEIGEGFRFVRETVDIRALFILLLATSLVIMGPWQTLLPRVAEVQLDAGELRTGMLFAAMGVGTVVSSLVLASIPRLKNAGGWFTCTLIVGGSLAVGIGLSHSYTLTALLMLLSGLNAGFFINLNLTLIQAHTPGDVMGRIMAIYTLVLMGGSPFGGLLAGGGAELLGAGGWFALCGGMVAVVAAMFLMTAAEPATDALAPRAAHRCNRWLGAVLSRCLSPRRRPPSSARVAGRETDEQHRGTPRRAGSARYRAGG